MFHSYYPKSADCADGDRNFSICHMQSKLSLKNVPLLQNMVGFLAMLKECHATKLKSQDVGEFLERG